MCVRDYCLSGLMKIDGDHSEYLYKVMTTTRAACRDRKNLDCKGWDTILLSAPHLFIALGLFGGI
jgi:hypothetical protein